MYITRANPKGGRALRPNHFPLHQDKEGNFGYLIGYREDGDKVLVPIALAEQIGNQFGSGVTGLAKMLNKVKPKLSLREWLFIKLFGKRQYRELKEEYEEGD